MTITALTDVSRLPVRTMDQITFDQFMAEFMSNLPLRAQQENALAANLNSIAVGGAYAIPYSLGVNGNIGGVNGGYLSLDGSSGTQATATLINVDIKDARAKSVSALLDSLVAGATSTIKGSIRLVKTSDPSKYLVFTVSSLSSPAGYKYFSATCTDYSEANPFTVNDPIMLLFTRTGDKGDTGTPGANYIQLLGSATVGAAVANIDFLNVFTSAYDTYTIELEGLLPSVNDQLLMRMANAGVADTGLNTFISPSDNTATTTSASYFPITTALLSNSGGGMSATLSVTNANSTTRMKGLSAVGMLNSSVPDYRSIIRAGCYTGANAVSGFRLLWNAGSNFAGGTVRVYGHKNT